MPFSIGCAVWAYRSWVGSLFPPGSRTSEFLNLYSHRFSAVEGNTTFYSIPSSDQIDRWVTDTPSYFKFCLKLPRSITHQGLLQPSVPALFKFLDQMQGLETRLGPLFAQLPPSYDPASFQDLKTFLQAWPHNRAALALEVRHQDWFREPHASRLNSLLIDLGVGRVLLDTRPIYECPDDPQVNSERRKPKLPLKPTVTAPFSLIRYISHPELYRNQIYLEAWAVQISQWLDQGTEIYFFVHCPMEVRSPAIARHFQHCLELQSLESQNSFIPPLPWNQLASPPLQLNLF
ncbi:MAG: DUF72 domain-containing protein [Cyanothece sp. SIO1E1]|nr:DUF72 domain-containing protein [Cyanothece sp. SIO1E1]